MTIPTEPIGSIPRPDYLVSALAEHATVRLTADALAESCERAVAETIAAFE